jgi:hypothetical protein
MVKIFCPSRTEYVYKEVNSNNRYPNKPDEIKLYFQAPWLEGSDKKRKG